jgi:demethylmenaquinone methyltransferase/2-methoxy-6-polyprenyl-1,4-benzoquinol methylase
LTAMTTTLLDKREVRIRKMFGAIAPTYDLLNHLLSMNVDRYWRRRTAQLVPPAGDGPILDLCTGTGDLALAYQRASDGKVPIIGADFCGEMLDRATHKVSAKNGQASLVRFVQADAQRLPFRDNFFQIVCVAFGLRNVTDADKGLAEMTRVAKPGGKVAILEFSKPRGSVFGKLYRFYLGYLLPLLGQSVTRSKDKAYHYLAESAMEFPDGEALADRMKMHGLTEVRWQPFTFGIATLYVGAKPPH